MAALCPPPRVQSTLVLVAFAPVTALYQMCKSGGTHGLAPIDGVVCPEVRGTSRTTLIRETRARQQDDRLTKRCARIRSFRRRCLVPIGLFFYQSLMLLARGSPRVLAVLCDCPIFLYTT